MIEVYGNIWEYHAKDLLETYSVADVICITTNGTVKKNGKLVMGRGIARQAACRYPPLPALLGAHVTQHGNTPNIFLVFGTRFYTFPVKHNWWEVANLTLIKQSATSLEIIANSNPGYAFVLPRPGCGNGQLEWVDVKPIIEPILPDNVHVITDTYA